MPRDTQAGDGDQESQQVQAGPVASRQMQGQERRPCYESAVMAVRNGTLPELNRDHLVIARASHKKQRS